jgi:hypothetical protein
MSNFPSRLLAPDAALAVMGNIVEAKVVNISARGATIMVLDILDEEPL